MGTTIMTTVFTAPTAHNLATDRGKDASHLKFGLADGGFLAIYMPFPIAQAVAAAYAEAMHPGCDLCGERVDLRTIHADFAPTHVCADCFAKSDGENDFRDFPLKGVR